MRFLTGRDATRFFTITRFAACFLIMTRSARAVSAIWTAPPPTTAPPQAQAQSLAKAIRTDISLLSCP
jgi:hypothetical protein